MILSQHTLLSIQFACCLYMTGVIAVIQLIHYPSFSLIDHTHFTDFHARHSQALGIIAGPVMLIELVSALWLAVGRDPYFLANLLAVLLLWGITFFVSVPMHNRLSVRFDQGAWTLLLRTNWLRTFLWTARSLLLLATVASGADCG